MPELSFDENRAFHLLKEHFAFGPRPVGSRAHEEYQTYLCDKLSPLVDAFHPHIFKEAFFNKECICKNIAGTIYGRNKRRRILIGSHYDTRLYADEDRDPLNRTKPVPGANDGASGIAVLFELARIFNIKKPRFNLEIVFFDAEDWGHIDGKDVSLGARRYVKDNIDNLPDKVIIIDMVGGKNLELDVDLHCFIHKSSEELTLHLFRLGRSFKYPAYNFTKPNAIKYIACDHIPFIFKRIPTTILIDIDYLPWHTLEDTVENCDPYSLKQVGDVLYEYLR
ncbi:MAG: Peptidase family M28 [bacterium ADurb.Bin363]|nr:MAG: Peptidase family M28 [bacterium ADurb.Bin363]